MSVNAALTIKSYNLTHDDSALVAHRLTPSGYCGTVIEHILLPVVEAATHLCEEHQCMFVALSVCIFVNEFRKIVTANKKTYRCVLPANLQVSEQNLLPGWFFPSYTQDWCRTAAPH